MIGLKADANAYLRLPSAVFILVTALFRPESNPATSFSALIRADRRRLNRKKKERTPKPYRISVRRPILNPSLVCAVLVLRPSRLLPSDLMPSTMLFLTMPARLLAASAAAEPMPRRMPARPAAASLAAPAAALRAADAIPSRADLARLPTPAHMEPVAMYACAACWMAPRMPYHLASASSGGSATVSSGTSVSASVAGRPAVSRSSCSLFSASSNF